VISQRKFCLNVVYLWYICCDICGCFYLLIGLFGMKYFVSDSIVYSNI